MTDAPPLEPWQDPTAKPLIEINNVSRRFGETAAVDGVSLKIYQGEFFALLGPSGCGKTTLLRMLAGFEELSSGQILIDGQDMADVPPNERPVNMMFQSYALFPHLTVAQNLAFGLKRSSMAKSEIESRVDEMLRLVQLSEYANRRPHQLSGGQKQRVALARALAKSPKLLLLDEPLGALDKKLRQRTQFELVDIQEKTGTTFVIVTHDQEEAMTMSTRIAVMERGKVRQVDEPQRIYEQPNSLYVADFIGDINVLRGDFARQEELGSVTVLGGLTKLTGMLGQGVEDCTEAVLTVRPEKMNVSISKPKSVDNLLRGQVIDIAYLGNLSTYVVKLKDGTLIKCQMVNSNRTRLRKITWDDHVWVSWNNTSGLILPCEEE